MATLWCLWNRHYIEIFSILVKLVVVDMGSDMSNSYSEAGSKTALAALALATESFSQL